MTTIRVEMHAQQQQHRQSRSGYDARCRCQRAWPCPDRLRADRVIAALDTAPYEHIVNRPNGPMFRLIADPPSVEAENA